MKTFKEYLAEKKQVLSWDSGNAESRPSVLSWDSGHAEVRSDSLAEEVTARTKINAWSDSTEEERKERKDKTNKKGGTYNATIHDHDDVRPVRLSNATAIDHYTSSPSSSVTGHGSSKNINGYLRNKHGDKSVHVDRHPPEAVHKSVVALSSNFTPANTNRKAITTYSGVPPHIGEKLESSKKGDIHHLSGFTSTSTSKATADDFAANHNRANRDVRHIVKFHVHPGAGLSVAGKSEYSENEVMLHHGAKTEYSHTEINTGKAHDRLTSSGKTIEHHIHHVFVHPEHLKLSEYGQYDHPK